MSERHLAENERPLVTALINNYNYARYLPFAINSVLKQTYDNIEIVVVDDGSFDNSLEVLASYGERLRVIATQNGGQGHAFNIGIAAARGDLIMMLDADDVWLPQKVEHMVRLAAENPSAGMLYHKFVNVDVYGVEAPVAQPEWLVSGDFRDKYIRAGGHYWHPITSVLVLRSGHARALLPLPSYAVREGADSIISDASMLLTSIASSDQALTKRLLHGSNLYAAGREEFDRSNAVRVGDVRRIEWRAFYIAKIIERFGGAIKIDLERNEWRMINRYLLGDIPLWRVFRSIMLSPDPASWQERIKRLLWLRSLRASLPRR